MSAAISRRRSPGAGSRTCVPSSSQRPVAVGSAEVVNGGYRVTGRWPFGSGTPHATHFMGLATVGGNQASDQPRLCCYFDRIQVAVHDTWHVSGLRGTGSSDFEVRGAFVPAERVHPFIGHAPSDPGLLYRMPPVSVFAWTVSVVPLGIARGAIEAFVTLVGTKSRLGVVGSKRDRELVQAMVGRAETLHAAARSLLAEAMSELMAATDVGNSRAQQSMTPSDLVSRLESLFEENGNLFARLSIITEAEAQFARQMAEFKGYSALSKASRCLFLETVERYNTEIRPALKTPLPSGHPLLVERLVRIFESLRAAEVTALNGYPLQGFTILRNVYDSCVLSSAALQGLSDFERLQGIVPGEAFDARKTIKNRKAEEHRVRHKMDGNESGLAATTLELLRTVDGMYDWETHGGGISLALSSGWLKGQEPLAARPVFSEVKASLFMNRFSQVAWMAHRLMPLIQPAGVQLAGEWAAKWDAVDESFAAMVMSLTKQLRKPIGEAVCDFVRAKFPFSSASEFPR